MDGEAARARNQTGAGRNACATSAAAPAHENLDAAPLPALPCAGGRFPAARPRATPLDKEAPR
jgi:hypothetical protein